MGKEVSQYHAAPVELDRKFILLQHTGSGKACEGGGRC